MDRNGGLSHAQEEQLQAYESNQSASYDQRTSCPPPLACGLDMRCRADEPSCNQGGYLWLFADRLASDALLFCLIKKQTHTFCRFALLILLDFDAPDPFEGKYVSSWSG